MSKPLKPEPPAAAPPSLSLLLKLPPELHLQISSHLPYPDALALKHTSPHFYALVSTNVKKKVAWLISRHERRLHCPATKCILTSDTAFCLWPDGEVKMIMEKRRRHMECKTGKRGCEVIVGGTCEGPQMSAKERLWKGKDWIEGFTGKWTYWALAALVVSICVNIYLVAIEAIPGIIAAGEAFVGS